MNATPEDPAPVWLEVALNGPWGRDRQPLLPLSVAEIVAEGVACAKAGAAIIHVHSRDPETGVQRDDADLYAAIIEGIRGQVECIVYPTLPLAGAAGHAAGDTVAARFAAVEGLAARGLLEWTVVDPGSVNFLHRDGVAEGDDGFLYRNPGDHIRAGLDVARRAGAVPSFAIYEPGFTRAGAALAGALGTREPVYRFMFTDGFHWGFPARDWALDAHLRLLEEIAPGAPWMVAGLDVDILPLAATAIARGGHLRVGLEDAPFGTRLPNIAWVERGLAAIEAAGRRPATPGEVRAAWQG
ncbi:MAG: 3-keto-5-aminohexanoate cleavage protein [Rhodobacteraceae bacterium]|nr:3-keto-5-aminohexanoate cleavage protein [Paracoccaceae bacterium]